LFVLVPEEGENGRGRRRTGGKARRTGAPLRYEALAGTSQVSSSGTRPPSAPATKPHTS